MKRWLKEPLIHFLLIGGFLFFLHWFLNRNQNNPENYTIILDENDIDRLSGAYQKNWGKLPDSATLEQLIETEIKSEILYREALRMKLDHNDEIIRRRLKQKYEFLISDLNEQQQPSRGALKAFYEERTDQYQHPKTLSFHQVYFNPDNRVNPVGDAKNLLKKIKAQNLSFDNIARSGDPFHLPGYFSERDQQAIRQLFGQTFADSLFQHEKTGWVGPLTSGYGQHLVRITAVNPPVSIPFEDVQDRVIADWKRENLKLYNEQLYENLRMQYKIIFDFGQRGKDE